MASPRVSIDQHNSEIEANLTSWQQKPLLRLVYRRFHELIAQFVTRTGDGVIVELGSGIGNIKEVIPECLRTDIFPNPWIDQVEDAYRLGFADSSVSSLILFDVFHHLRYPGTAFEEFFRVLTPGGRVILFEPYLSLLGSIVYGLCHHEPVGFFQPITWRAPEGWSPSEESYYAAQGNATRVFWGASQSERLPQWTLIAKHRYSCISYVASGGYSRPALYPLGAYGLMRAVDRVADYLPFLCATRTLIVLEKPVGKSGSADILSAS